MAVVFRSTSDLLYLPDHGFVEENGAIKILLQINRQIRRLDVSHNLLGTEGINVLVQGLTSCRHRFSSTDYGIWGLKDINLGSNSIADDAFSNIMSYAKKDVFMRRVTVQGNDIKLEHHLDSIINSLNASHIEDLSLTNNHSLLPTSICKLFDSLTTPHLSQLYLSVCNIGPEVLKSLLPYLRSPRSRNLELLELNGNALGVEGVTAIIDTIEKYNFSIKHVSLLANDVLRAKYNADGTLDTVTGASVEQRTKENEALGYQCHQRLPEVLKRNRTLTQRTRRAAIRVIAPARTLLTARPLNEEEIARQVIDTIPNGDETASPRPFPILNLPREVLYLVVRHCSSDPTAFSEAQFTRLRTEAEDRQSMGTLRRVMRERMLKADSDQIGRAIWEVREEWLRKGKWDKWELDRPLEMPRDDPEEDEPVNGVDALSQGVDKMVITGEPSTVNVRQVKVK